MSVIFDLTVGTIPVPRAVSALIVGSFSRTRRVYLKKVALGACFFQKRESLLIKGQNNRNSNNSEHRDSANQSAGKPNA
jgi:hypothetical protein